MSGGSMDYVCYKVADASNMTGDPLIAEILADLAKVLHAEEWYLSCDTSEENYLNELTRFKEKWLHITFTPCCFANGNLIAARQNGKEACPLIRAIKENAERTTTVSGYGNMSGSDMPYGYCDTCGGEVPVDSRYCPDCGAKVVNE